MPYITNSRSVEALARLELAREDERGYIASERQSVTSSSTFNMHLANPADSGRHLSVELISISTQFEAVVDVFDTFSTAPSGGSSAVVDNLLLDTGQVDGDTNANVKTNVSFTGDSAHFTNVIPGGGSGGLAGGQSVRIGPYMEEDREIVIEVTNQSGSENDAAITLIYAEEAP